jgi:uncharacterized membrane protein
MRTPGRKRRVFLWVFLAIQAGFIAWIITGAAAGHGSCSGLSARDCADAADTGKSIGVALIVILWCVADFLLAVIYGIYRLARKPS